MRVRQQAGLIRLEWIAWLLIVGVLASVLLQRLVHYQALARSAVMDMTVMSMRSGLRFRVAELMVSNRGDQMAGLLNQNPITFLDRLPPNYLGQLKQPDAAALPKDSWYFDPVLHELIYLFQKNDVEWMAESSTESRAKSLHVRVVARKPPSETNASSIVEGVSLDMRYHK